MAKTKVISLKLGISNELTFDLEETQVQQVCDLLDSVSALDYQYVEGHGKIYKYSSDLEIRVHSADIMTQAEIDELVGQAAVAAG